VNAGQVCIVLPDLANAAQALLAAYKLSRGMHEAAADTPGEPWVRPLIGIACFPDQAEDEASLLMQADAAMAEAEASEEGIFLFPQDRMVEAAQQLPAVRGQILDALRFNDFRIAYQPQLHLASGRCDSVEALLRCTLPDGTLLSPPLLVAAAEQEGKVGALTAGILNTSLRQLSAWVRSGLSMRVSVNLSPHNLRDPDLPAVVARSLSSWGVDAAHLTLEIVESSMIRSFSEAASVLHRLKELGVKLAVDDFGTGYSCLAYLRQLPLDELKMDRAFVRNMLQSKSDRQLVQAMIDLAHNFDLHAVAEGVEDEPTLQALQEMGCDLVQGYAVSPALEAEGFASWIGAFPGQRPVGGDGREREIGRTTP
jgi:EAL domain-containing protein (putative c-di-GMP-specific phosphodiesterase class I)